jgi:hypothetical protein
MAQAITFRAFGAERFEFCHRLFIAGFGNQAETKSVKRTAEGIAIWPLSFSRPLHGLQLLQLISQQ